MAAFLIDYRLRLRADSAAPPCFPVRRDRLRCATGLSETFRTIRGMTCEWLALLWMLAVVAFSLLMTAGAAGFLGLTNPG